MNKLKFKHPTKSEPIEVLMELYSIGVYIDYVNNKLKECVKILSMKGKEEVYDIKSGWDGKVTPYEIKNCDPNNVYTVIWLIDNDNLINENNLLRNLVEILVGCDYVGEDMFPMKSYNFPGGMKSYNLSRQSVMFAKIPGSDNENIYSITTSLDIEQHPDMIKLYREKRLGDSLG
jgi:hypothetical protein